MISTVLMLALVAGAEDVAPPSGAALWPLHLTVSAGTYLNANDAVATLRVSVEPIFYRRGRDELSAQVELGAGVGYAIENGYSQNLDYTGVAGIVYRNDHELWEWGFRLGLGALWYRITLAPGQPFAHFQQAVLLYSEGRVHLALALGPRVRLGVFLGYGSTPYYNPNFRWTLLVGGFVTGLYVDLR
jgi:hypothetical protein